MAFGSMESGDEDAPLTEINMVPLIDVMLVLLIIFIVTAPLLTHAVKVDLPRAASTANQTKPDNVQVAIDVDGNTLWNGEPVDAAQFNARLAAAGALQPQPELHIRADRMTPYEKVAQVMSDAARNGLTRIGFVTDPTGIER
ncbi:MAG: biopolymer transporter ExbD [Azospira sp.]|jgi:biopolymer transport protein ExbD|nr:biopolymer transporter ExbD [Azospira sp.]